MMYYSAESAYCKNKTETSVNVTSYAFINVKLR